MNDDWETASLSAVGVDPGPLTKLMNRLRGYPGHFVEGIVIAVLGQLVFEEYFDGVTHPNYGEQPISYDRRTKHCLSSFAGGSYWRSPLLSPHEMMVSYINFPGS